MKSTDTVLYNTIKKDNNLSFSNLIEEEVINVVGEKSSELTLLGLTRPHIHLNLLNKSEEKSYDKQL